MGEEKIRVIQWATGAVGAEMVKIMAERPGFEVVGAIVHHPEKAGRDLGEVVRLGRPLGVLTSANPQELFSRVRADLVLHATAADLQANVVDIHSCVEAGLDVITVSGLSYPWRRHPRVARQLDEAAQAQGVTILGTGINPGYLLDLLPVVLSGLCTRVDRIYMRRVSEMGHYDSVPVLQSVGIGLSPEEFQRRSREGNLLLGELFLEVVDMVAAALGWELTKTEVSQEPILARRPRRTACMEIPAGMTCGVRVVLRGKVDEETVIVLEEPMLVDIDPAEDSLEYGTTLRIEGDPTLEMTLRDNICHNVARATATVAVNAIPHVLAAPPGLTSMLELPPIPPSQGFLIVRR